MERRRLEYVVLGPYPFAPLTSRTIAYIASCNDLLAILLCKEVHFSVHFLNPLNG